jgi:hypothetical protein
VQVERGALRVDGQTIAPGATYFAPSCPPAGRSPTAECVTFEVGSETAVKFSCFLNRVVRVLVVLDETTLNAEDYDLLLDVLVIALLEKCGLSGARQGEWALDLGVRQGAAHVSGLVDGRISLVAGPATARLDGPGSFLAGYDPTAGQAIFQAFGAPLGVEPQTGAAFSLPPYSRVTVTAAGAGPVTPLARLYLPMQQR